MSSVCVGHLGYRTELCLFFLTQQREEKQLEASVESLISRVAHVKSALHNFIYKLENEYERLTW